MVQLDERDGYPAVDQRNVTFLRDDGVAVLSIGVIPNPNGLTVEDWVATYPGTPGEAQEILVDGEAGVMFDMSAIGETASLVYVAHESYIYLISGNVHGSGEAQLPTALTAKDFDHIVVGAQFLQ